MERVKGRARRALAAALVVAAVGACAVVALAYAVPLPARLGLPGSRVVELRDGTPAYVFLSPDDKWRVPVALDDVDPRYLDALLRFEDRRFFWHPGVDPLALARAVLSNVARGEVVSGGSTLTMQLVRMVEPRPRTLRSKIVEALRAVQLEVRFDKRALLALYLTYVPFGKNIEGVEAASLSAFGHRSNALTPLEAATLLAVPQRPRERAPSEANARRLTRARNAIAARLFGPAVVDDSAAPSRLLPFPRLAPHAAVWLAAQHAEPARLRTTLDATAQRLAERVVARSHEEASRNGIANAAVVVVEHATGDVRALVGNPDFWDAKHGGQIASFAAPRSPGSALKPFIYARAIDRGEALPDFVVPDVPRTYGTYAPRNFDGAFRGVTRLEDALSQSLNIPFIDLLARIGIEDFTGLLRALGARSLNDTPGTYGLSAAVGSIEVTPLEMASFYAALARDGTALPLRFLDDEPPPPPGLRVLSRGASWLTQRALSLRDRPDFPSRRALQGVPARVHWKTGTSFGHRDAWAVGSNARFTVVVWLGNLDQRGSVHLVGADAAGPLLFDLLEALDDGKAQRVDAPPAELTPLEVCAVSGHVPGPACGATKVVLADKRHVPTTLCPYHVEIDVDDATGQSLTPSCRAGRRYTTTRYLVWPSSVRRTLASLARRFPEPPTRMVGCDGGAAQAGPRIVSPQAGQSALLVPGVDAHKQEIPLEADGGAAEGSLSWFVDGAFLGATKSEQRLWWTPRAGTHEIVVMDADGRSARRTFDVRALP